MKKSILFPLSILFLTLTILSGCQSSATKVENAEDNVRGTEKTSISDYQQFKLDADQKITDQEKNIAEYKARIAQEKMENRADYEQRLVELENKNSDLKKKLADLKDDGQDTWVSFKNEFNHDMDELGKAFKDLTVENVK
jgi:hypothetical protein